MFIFTRRVGECHIVDGNIKIAVLRLIVVLTALAAVPSARGASLTTTEFEGDKLTFLRIGATLFDGPLDRFENFWSFCRNVKQGCNYSPDPEVNLRSTGSSGWSLAQGSGIIVSESTAERAGTVDATFFAFPKSESGAVRLIFDSSTELLMTDYFGAPFPLDRTLGYSFLTRASHYLTDIGSGSKEYTLAATFDALRIPESYNILRETTLAVLVFDDWVDKDGRPQKYEATLIDEVFQGNFSTSFTLPNRLSDVVPDSLSTWATASILVETRLTYKPVAPVPLPSGFWLLGTVVCCVAGFTRIRA